jgi:hypothetical protein
MDLALLRKQLAKAERHLAECEMTVRRQEAIIQSLEESGCSTRLAFDLLNTYEEQRDQCANHRDRVRDAIERFQNLH